MLNIGTPGMSAGALFSAWGIQEQTGGFPRDKNSSLISEKSGGIHAYISGT